MSYAVKSRIVWSPLQVLPVASWWAYEEANRRGLTNVQTADMEQILDSSGAGNTALQTIAGSRLTCLHDGSGWIWRTGGSRFAKAPVVTLAASGSILIVLGGMTAPGNGNFGMAFAEADTALDSRHLSFGIIQASDVLYAMIRQRNNDTVDVVRGSTPVPSAAGSRTYILYESSGSVFRIRVNGIVQTLTVAGGSNNGHWANQVTGLDNSYIGCRTDGAGSANNFVGDIAGIVVTNRVLNETGDEHRQRQYYQIRTTSRTRVGITFPQDMGGWQADDSGNATVTANGTWEGDAPEGIEVQFKSGGAWNAATVVGSTWSVSIAGQTGTGVLTARYTNDTTKLATVTAIVGDAGAHLGQSNQEGPGNSAQTYSLTSPLRVSMIGRNGRFRDAQEPPVASDTSSDAGSYKPLLGEIIVDHTGRSVMILDGAVGGTSLLTDWVPGQNTYERFLQTLDAAGLTRQPKFGTLGQGGADMTDPTITRAIWAQAAVDLMDNLHIARPFGAADAWTDTFTAADGTTLAGRAPTTGTGAWDVEYGALEISGNRLVPVAGIGADASYGYVATLDLGRKGASLKLDFTVPAGGDWLPGFFVRWDAATQTGYQVRPRTGDGAGAKLQIASFTGGVAANEKTVSIALTEGSTYTLCTRATGTQILAWIEDAAGATLEGSENNFRTATLNPLGTVYGIRFTEALGWADNFVVEGMASWPVVSWISGEFVDAETTDAGRNEVRMGQILLWALSAAGRNMLRPGPNLVPIPTQDGKHFKTNAQLALVAALLGYSVNWQMFGAIGGRGPQFVSASQTGARQVTIVTNVTHGPLLPGASPAIGHRLRDDAGTLTVLSATVSSPNIVVNYDRDIGTGPLISFGFGNDGMGTATIKDSHALGLGLEPFIEEAVA